MCTCVRVYMCTCVHVYVCTCVPAYVCTCVHVYLCTCVVLCMFWQRDIVYFARSLVSPNAKKNHMNSCQVFRYCKGRGLVNGVDQK